LPVAIQIEEPFPFVEDADFGFAVAVEIAGDGNGLGQAKHGMRRLVGRSVDEPHAVAQAFRLPFRPFDP
jgi:hypothetical protein